MDLLDFDGQALYFDAAPDSRVSQLLAQAADDYGDGTAELPLLQAYFLAPQDLNVLVSLYRFYYYQHRLDDTLVVADRALAIVQQKLDLPSDWRTLQVADINESANRPMALVRFYLMALKGKAYLLLRQQNLEAGREILTKLLELDSEDRLNASVLMDVVEEATRFKLVVSN